MASPRYVGANRLLAALSGPDFALLNPHLEPIDLALRMPLEKANKPISHVYFFEEGFASVVGATSRAPRHVEVGLIGWEGMSGGAVVLGNHRSPHETYMQSAGKGLRVKASALQRHLADRPTTLKVLLKYIQAFNVQVAQTAVANGRGSIEQRLARWLLMAHDRTAGDTLTLTHEFISIMLGVRRPGVTEGLHELQRKGAIAPGHSHVRIMDRERLQTLAGALYGVPEMELDRLLRPRQKH